MRTINQAEAEVRRDALKRIASFGNPTVHQSEPSQAAASVARRTLDELRLYYQKDANDANRK